MFSFRPATLPRTILIILFCLAVWIYQPSAQALTQIRLFDLSYEVCPEEMQGLFTSGSALEANCFLVKGKAENKSGKPVYNADIYGRIYDANENPILQNRTRLGAIAEVPPGVSDFELRISVPANQPTPLKLEQFKAAGFSGRVRR